MLIIIIFSSIIFGAIGLALLFNKRFEQTVCIWVLSLVLVLYSFGLAGALLPGVYFVLIASALLAVYSVVKVIMNKHVIMKNILTPGLVAFSLLFAAVYFLNARRLYTGWDEFSHWGTAVKNMYLLDGFANHPLSNAHYAEYPPATALLHYFFVKVKGVFYEGYTYISMGTLYAAMAVNVFKNLIFKNVGDICLRFLLIVTLPILFYDNFYSSLYVDAMLGILFGFALFNHFTSEYKTFSILTTGIALGFLAITKNSGLALSIIALLIIVLDLVFAKREEFKLFFFSYKNKKTYAKGSRFVKALHCSKQSLIVSSALLLPLITKYSWKIYIASINLGDRWQVSEKLTFSSIFNLISGNLEPVKLVIIENFKLGLFSKALSTVSGSYVLTAFSWLLIIGFISIIFIRLVNNEEKKRFKVFIIAVIAGIGVYIFSTLFIYVFSLPEAAGTALLSFSRYLSTIYLGSLFAVSTIFVYKDKKCLKTAKGIFSLILVFGLFMVSYFPTAVDTFNKASINDTLSARNSYLPVERMLPYLGPEDDFVFFVACDGNGHQSNVCNFMVAPTGSFTFVIADDNELTLSEFSDMIKSRAATHVYLYNIDRQFIERYSDLFIGGEPVIEDHAFFLVDNSEDLVKLKLISLYE